MTGAGPRRARFAPAAVAVVLAVTSCSEGSTLPPAPTAIDVTMTEYAFEVSDDSVPPGRAVFEVENAGRLDHDLTLEALPEDFLPINEQLQSDTRRGAPTVAILPARGPGETDAFAVDLVPGRYALVCFVTDDDGVQHSRKGMATEIRVRS